MMQGSSDEVLPRYGFNFQWLFDDSVPPRGPDERALDFNEPPAIGLRGFDRRVHERLMRRTIDAIRAIDAERPIVLDGIDGGNVALPELADLGATHSTRGYQPYPVSHWGATWWDGWREGDGSHYPGVVYEGTTWGRDEVAAVYEPWRAVQARGVEIHVGEFGCYDHTANDDALRWLGDLIRLFHQFGWGYALWNFEGPFGIIGHRRPGARFEYRDGYLVDVELLDLLRSR